MPPSPTGRNSRDVPDLVPDLVPDGGLGGAVRAPPRSVSLGSLRGRGRELFVALVMIATLFSRAEARSEKHVSWDMKKVFPTAVRFLRIDEHAAIVEKDAEAGYVLF